ncbi:MAG: response regulator transcription factor [Streptosporangiaceae bacterium]|nr:response regulator transcription factor [Streptosporangiaceae bacterium]MBV9854022.1 response regulator transcription factor [Streptosporangiaceae bacterium]
MTAETTIFVVDNHPAVRLGLSMLLAGRTGVRVLGGAATSERALNSISDLQPDLVVLDPVLPGENTGIGLCRQVQRFEEPPYVLVYTAGASHASVAAALASGATSFVHKATAIDELVNAIERTLRGERVWLIDATPQAGVCPDRVLLGSTPLTVRERDVLSLLARRYRTDEIAVELQLSRQTVKNHVSSIFRKLGVSSRSDLYTRLRY